MKRFGTQLKELLAGLDSEEKLTPSELIKKVKDLRNGGTPYNTVSFDGVFKNAKFVRKINKHYRLSPSGRVVLYFRKGTPMVMTLERMVILQGTVKKAHAGLRKYYDKRAVA